nr:MAG TPA: hydrogenase/urease nickel incorporation protein [Caudoviricetes sp.]
MSDYISRKAAVKIAQKYGLANGSALGRHAGLADCIAIEIEGLPAADVEPVRHGRWLDCEAHNDIEQCSECGMIFSYPSYYRYKFCPNCGAKMDLGDENNDD